MWSLPAHCLGGEGTGARPLVLVYEVVGSARALCATERTMGFVTFGDRTARVESEGSRARLSLRVFAVSAVLTLATFLSLISVVAVDLSAQVSWPWQVPWYMAALAVGCVFSVALVLGSSATALFFEVRQARALADLTAALENVPREAWSPVEDMAGWKIAKVTGVSAKELSFAGIGYGAYPVSGSASCELGQEHHVPSPSCSCGFHAFYDIAHARREWRSYPHCVLLRVEGFGDVVEHEMGWRAQSQEVLTVWIAQECASCSRPSQGLSWSSRSECWAASCEKCANRHGSDFATVADLASSWGTEVRLFDPRLTA